MSPELTKHLRDMFPPEKPEQPDREAHKRAVKEGISMGWMPRYPGEEPPF